MPTFQSLPSLRPASSRARAEAEGDRPEPAGRVLGVTRLGVLGLLVLAAANGLFLYLVPGRAEFDYAWAIKPPINAAFIGAGFLAGTVATALVVFRARSWRSLRILPLPLGVLATTLLSATIIHQDRFFWDYAPTWGWTAVYGVVPVLVVVFWRLQERVGEPVPAADPRLRPLRARSAVLGAVLTAGALALFLAPVGLADLWPWPLTPLLARAVAGWYLLFGCALLTASVSLRRYHEVPIFYATLLVWCALLLALPALYAGDLADRPVALIVWLLVHGLLLALAGSALARTLRAGAERL